MGTIGAPGAALDRELQRPPSPESSGGAVFDEEIYLRLNPDVRLAVTSGGFRSGREHYERYGRAEGRPIELRGQISLDRVTVSANADIVRERVKFPACVVDKISISASGGIFISGWVNDALDALDSAELYFSGWTLAFDGKSLARLRRRDAETALATSPLHAYGFWGFLYAARRLAGGVCNVVLRLKSGVETSLMVTAETIGDDEMRKIVLNQLGHAEYSGNPEFAAAAGIEHSIGAQIVDFNKMLSRRALNAPYVKRFGNAARRYRASFVICLYGRVESVFLQSAMFAALQGVADYEFIFVSNDPEITSKLLNEVELCARIYGLDMSVVCLGGNAGFAGANNAAAQFASSNRLIVVNPDVFPKDPDWIKNHTAVLESAPVEQTAVFGAPLYYGDGALMHGGMYFEMDTAPGFARGRMVQTSLLRVAHYGRGAPPETAHFLHPRPVPAITGAFMSIEKSWFEKLGGFSQNYVFNLYEDADFCLKSINAGRLPWLHDLRLWHLEGKGSTREPQHEGASAINRWLFTKNWGDAVTENLLGQAPAHAAFGRARA